MGTLESKRGPFGDPKAEKGPHGDPGPQIGTHMGARLSLTATSPIILTAPKIETSMQGWYTGDHFIETHSSYGDIEFSLSASHV